jgi:hypothetical protein
MSRIIFAACFGSLWYSGGHGFGGRLAVLVIKRQYTLVESTLPPVKAVPPEKAAEMPVP